MKYQDGKKRTATMRKNAEEILKKQKVKPTILGYQVAIIRITKHLEDLNALKRLYDLADYLCTK